MANSPRPDAPPDARPDRRRLLAALAGLGLPGARAAAPVAAPQPAAVLPPEVAQALRATGLPSSAFGLHARQVDGPAVRLSLNAEQAFSLASTTKVITSLAALDLLGPRFRWRTYAYATGPLVQGRLLGDLVIVGGGDASLTTEDLRTWFADIQAKGVQQIWGDLVLDRQAFALTEADHSATPPPAPDRPHHVRPDALTLEEGVLRIGLRTSADGRGVAVTLTPPMDSLPLVNRVARGGGCSAWAALDRRQGWPTLVLQGRWSPNCAPHEIALAPLPHREFTAHAAAALWREDGRVLRGRVRDRADTFRWPDPIDAAGQPLAPVSAHLSAPLVEVMREINKTSDNMAARNLLLSLAPGFSTRPVTLAQALDRLHGWLRGQGFGPDDLAVRTGSGLSRDERGRPRALADLLRRGWAHRDAAAFRDSLPVAGVDGTLAHRLRGTAAEGRAWLKTGSLSDTRALAGYVRGASGRTWAVAAVVNHPGAARGTPALDAAIASLARDG